VQAASQRGLPCTVNPALCICQEARAFPHTNAIAVCKIPCSRGL